MAVLEIQANGDTRVTEEAITRARHSLSDPNMRVSSSPCPCELAVNVPGWAVRGLRQACRWCSQSQAASPALPLQGGPYQAGVLRGRPDGMREHPEHRDML